MTRRHEILQTRIIFRGKMLEVRVDTIRLPDGSESEREIVNHPGAVAVVALHDDQVLLVRQNRHAVGEDLLELPAGKLQRGEDPKACAARELEEETGYRAAALEPLGSFLTSPGFSNERVHLFLARSVEPSGPPPSADEGEPISTQLIPFATAVHDVRKGELGDSKTIIGLFLASERLGDGYGVNSMRESR